MKSFETLIYARLNSDLKKQREDDINENTANTGEGVRASAFGWMDRGSTPLLILLPAVSSLTLHFLPTHALTAALSARQPKERKSG